MGSTKQVLYLGTYERDYPRNVLTVAALRRAGFDVVELHASIWTGAYDKSALLSSPSALIHLGWRLFSAYGRLLVRLARRFGRADVVMFGYIGQLDVLLFGPLARLLGKPVIFNPLVTLTDTLVDDRRKFAPSSPAAGLIRLVDRLALGLSSLILVDTAENGRYLTEQFGISPQRIVVLPVGADQAVFRQKDASTHSSTPLSVLFYGNMIPLQGVDTIVRAAKLMHDDDVRFEIIGSGQMLHGARRLADELGVTNITWIGRVPYAELPRRIAEADIVLGIFGESAKAARVVPNKVFQAMAMGAAIITRDSSAQRTILVDGVSALLVPPADPARLADAIRRSRDPELRRRLGIAARQRFDEHASLDVQSDRLRPALDSAVCGTEKSWTGSVPV